MMQEKFPESTLEDRDILLGSYIFLRFYSPAIITPEFYGILTNANTLSLRVRRNLLHVRPHPSPVFISCFIVYGGACACVRVCACVETYDLSTSAFSDCKGAAKSGQQVPLRREGTLHGAHERIPQGTLKRHTHNLRS
jgi:hypothetical protein